MALVPEAILEKLEPMNTHEWPAHFFVFYHTVYRGTSAGFI